MGLKLGVLVGFVDGFSVGDAAKTRKSNMEYTLLTRVEVSVLRAKARNIKSHFRQKVKRTIKERVQVSVYYAKVKGSPLIGMYFMLCDSCGSCLLSLLCCGCLRLQPYLQQQINLN